MLPRHMLGVLLASLSVAIHFGVEYGLLVAAVAVLMLPSAEHPGSGYPARSRAAVEAVWRRLRGRRQTAAAVGMLVAIAGIGVGLGFAVGAAWGVLAASAIVAALCLRVDAAE